MAEAFFNHYHKDKIATSAGWKPDQHVHPATVQLMKEIGLDISHHIPRPLTRSLLKDAHKIIAINTNAFNQILKEYLSKTENWHIGKLQSKTIKQTRLIRDRIKSKVQSN